jgi:hypothetical protein
MLGDVRKKLDISMGYLCYRTILPPAAFDPCLGISGDIPHFLRATAGHGSKLSIMCTRHLSYPRTDSTPIAACLRKTGRKWLAEIAGAPAITPGRGIRASY